MNTSDENEKTATRKLKKDLIIFLLVYVNFVLVGLLMLTWQISRAPDDIQIPSAGFFLSPVLTAFVMGFLISLMIGKVATSSLVRKFRNQHVSKGFVFNNSNSIFGNLGFNLGMIVLLSISFGGRNICNFFVEENDLTSIFYCQSITSSVLVFFVGSIITLSYWVISQVVLIEKETNKIMMVQYYSTKQWSWTMVIAGAVIIYVIGRTFYK